jgi:putative tricarboxylic transport membrane protein
MLAASAFPRLVIATMPRFVLFLLCTLTGLAAAQSGGWVPTRPVELVVGVSPGGGVDRTARMLQKIVQDHRLLAVPLNVVNKPGGGGTIALAYLNQHAGDAHYLEITATSILTNQIIGRTPTGHRDFTPVVMLFDEYLGFAVHAESPMKQGRQLLDALKNPESLPIGIATSAGNTNHIGAALLAKAAGVDPRRLKVVVFGSGGESMTALLGKHVELVVTPSANLIAHIQSGRLRALGVCAPKRLPGALASIPTWAEQGVDAVVANWRPVVGSKAWSPAQSAFWDGVFAKLVQTEEWRQEVDRTGAVGHYLTGRELAGFFDSEHARFKVVLTELALAK